MPQPRQSRDKDQNRDFIDSIFDDYAEISKKFADMASSFNEISGMVLSLDKKIREFDGYDRLRLSQRLRLKIVFGAAMSICQHMNRLTARMNACSRMRQDIVSDANSFDQVIG